MTAETEPIDRHDDQRTAIWFADQILTGFDKHMWLRAARWVNDGDDPTVQARMAFFVNGIVTRARGSLATEAALALDEHGMKGLDHVLVEAMENEDRNHPTKRRTR